MSDFEKYQYKAKRLKLLEELYETVVALIAIAGAGLDTKVIAQKLYVAVCNIEDLKKK